MNIDVIRHAAGAALAAGIIGVAALAPAPATAEVTFKNQTITMIIGYGAGGGTDAVGRLLGRHLVKYLPGKPTLVVRNMPGASGIKALNYFVTLAKTDGTVITVGSSSQTDPVHWRASASRYDPREFHMLGGITRGSDLLLIKKDALARLHDKSKAPVVVGAIDGTRSGIIMSLWGGQYLGWNIKWVVGYGGTSALMLALRRGEIDMSSTANGFLIRELVKNGSHALLAQSGTLSNGKVGPRAEFPDVPLFPDMIRPHLKTKLDKEAFGYWEAINTTDKWAALPPKAKADVVKVYETAFHKGVEDKDFLSIAHKTISEDLTVISAADQNRLVDRVASTSGQALAFIDSIKHKQGLQTIKKNKKKKKRK